MDNAEENLESNGLDADEENVSLFKSSVSIQEDSLSQGAVGNIYDSDTPSNEFINMSSYGSKYNVDIQCPSSSTWTKDVIDIIWDSRGGCIEDENTESINGMSGPDRSEGGDKNYLKQQLGKLAGIGKAGWKSMHVGWKNEADVHEEKANPPNDHHVHARFATFLHILFIMYVCLILFLKRLQYPQHDHLEWFFVFAAVLIMLLIGQFFLMNANFSRYPQYHLLCRVVNVFLGILVLFCISYLESLTHRGLSVLSCISLYSPLFSHR